MKGGDLFLVMIARTAFGIPKSKLEPNARTKVPEVAEGRSGMS